MEGRKYKVWETRRPSARGFAPSDLACFVYSSHINPSGPTRGASSPSVTTRAGNRVTRGCESPRAGGCPRHRIAKGKLGWDKVILGSARTSLVYRCQRRSGKNGGSEHWSKRSREGIRKPSPRRPKRISQMGRSKRQTFVKESKNFLRIG